MKSKWVHLCAAALRKRTSIMADTFPQRLNRKVGSVSWAEGRRREQICVVTLFCTAWVFFYVCHHSTLHVMHLHVWSVTRQGQGWGTFLTLESRNSSQSHEWGADGLHLFHMRSFQHILVLFMHQLGDRVKFRDKKVSLTDINAVLRENSQGGKFSGK